MQLIIRSHDPIPFARPMLFAASFPFVERKIDFTGGIQAYLIDITSIHVQKWLRDSRPIIIFTTINPHENKMTCASVKNGTILVED
jgi:hypothetical protein